MSQSAKPLSEMTLEELWQLFPIILSEHDPDWTKYYDEEKALLEKQFGSLTVRFSHIGSTAVEGLIAKPTADILLEVDPAFPLPGRCAAIRRGVRIYGHG